MVEEEDGTRTPSKELDGCLGVTRCGWRNFHSTTKGK